MPHAQIPVILPGCAAYFQHDLPASAINSFVQKPHIIEALEVPLQVRITQFRAPVEMLSVLNVTPVGEPGFHLQIDSHLLPRVMSRGSETMACQTTAWKASV